MSKDEQISALRSEMLDLTRGLDFVRDWQIAQTRTALGPDAEPDLNTFVEPGTVWLERFDKATRLSDKRFFLREVQQWYALTADDFRRLLSENNADVMQHLGALLDGFRSASGFDFFDKAGILQKTAKQVLKQGKVASHDEWYILSECVSNDLTHTLTAKEHQKVTEFMQSYEANQ